MSSWGKLGFVNIELFLKPYTRISVMEFEHGLWVCSVQLPFGLHKKSVAAKRKCWVSGSLLDKNNGDEERKDSTKFKETHYIGALRFHSCSSKGSTIKDTNTSNYRK